MENLEHAVALHYMHYNFCRIHQTLRVTPAMEAGVSDHVWSLDEIIQFLPEPTNSAGVVWIGVPVQCGGHGNGLGRGVGIGLVWAGTTAAMPAMNKSKQRITPKSRILNFILGVSTRSMCSAERASIPNCTTTERASTTKVQ